MISHRLLDNYKINRFVSISKFDAKQHRIRRQHRDGVLIAVFVLDDISNKERNIVFVSAYDVKIPRLSLRNDIVTQSHRKQYKF
jgi:hypothetical protein